MLPSHGKNKAKRGDLRQINLALIVTKDFGIPLLHLIYEGSTHDAKLFPDVTEELVSRYQIFAKECKRITLFLTRETTPEAKSMSSHKLQGTHLLRSRLECKLFLV